MGGDAVYCSPNLPWRREPLETLHEACSGLNSTNRPANDVLQLYPLAGGGNGGREREDERHESTCAAGRVSLLSAFFVPHVSHQQRKTTDGVIWPLVQTSSAEEDTSDDDDDVARRYAPDCGRRGGCGTVVVVGQRRAGLEGEGDRHRPAARTYTE